MCSHNTPRSLVNWKQQILVKILAPELTNILLEGDHNSLIIYYLPCVGSLVTAAPDEHGD